MEYDKEHRAETSKFKVGDTVYIKAGEKWLRLCSLVRALRNCIERKRKVKNERLRETRSGEYKQIETR